MPTTLMSFSVGPGSSFNWVALPGDEIYDPVNCRKIQRIDSGRKPYFRTIIIKRNDDLSLELPDGIWVWFPGDEWGYLTPLEKKIVIILPEPEFDLDEIELAEKLVANG